MTDITEDRVVECFNALGPTMKDPLIYVPAVMESLKVFKNLLPSHRFAAWMANCARETQGFTRMEENLHYSPKRMMAMWPRRFPDAATAQRYAGYPRKIASRAYAGKIGNGDEGTEDGWKYRGRGFPQLTGRDNYADFGRAVGKDYLSDPDALLSPMAAVQAGMWFWSSRDLGDLADKGDFRAIVIRWRGGTDDEDLEARTKNLRIAQRIMMVKV